MIKNKIIKYTFLAYAFIMLLSIFFIILGVIDAGLWRSIILPYSLTTIYFAAGIISINYGMNKSTQVFLMSLFGGMVLRMFFILFLVFVSIKFFAIDLWIYITVLFATYFFYLITEIVFLNLLKTKQLK